MFLVFNPADYRTAEKTVVVLGCGRGGTSALAGILRLLGVSMHADTHPLKHESSPIVYRDGVVEINQTQKNVASLNAQYAVWGWKSPGDLFSTGLFSGILRNPHYIVVTRSMTDIIASSAKHEDVNPKSIARDVGAVFDEIGRFLTMNIYPTASLSYEGIVSNPRKMILEIVEWLGLTPSVDQIDKAVRFIENGGLAYKTVDSDRGVFSKDEIERDMASAHARNYTSCTKSFEEAEMAYVNACSDAEKVLSHLRARIAELVISRGNLGLQGEAIARQMVFLTLDEIKRLLVDSSTALPLPDDLPDTEDTVPEADHHAVPEATNLDTSVFKMGFRMAWDRYSKAAFRREELGKALDDAAQKLNYIERLFNYRDSAAEQAAISLASEPQAVEGAEA